MNITLAGTARPCRRGHQTWQMNEINKLVWPANAAGIGVMNKAAYDQTAQIAQQFGVIKKAPRARYRTDLATKARHAAEERRRRRARQEVEDGRREADGGRQVASSRERRAAARGPPL